MIIKYNEFLFESIINESVLVYSDKFKKLIDKIDSPVAKALSDLESKDFDITNNYIDIQDKEHISFILDRRVKQIEDNSKKFVTYTGGTGFLTHSDSNSKIFKELEYVPVGDKTYHPTRNERGEVLNKVTSTKTGKTYLRVSFPGGISVINENNIIYDDVRKLAFTQNRQPIRIGRGVRSILNSAKLSFNDSEIEQFVNKFKSEWDKMNDIFRFFELVDGDDIAMWYNLENYAEPNRGQLGNSCMRYENCQGYFGIYTENPDKCKLLILRDQNSDDKIKGRSLIWFLDSPKLVFMDRIYTNNDSDIDLFRQYALAKDWYYKEYNGSSSDTTIVGKSEKMRPNELSVNLKSERDGNYGAYPYLDTLKYFHYTTGLLTTDSSGSGKSRGSVYTLEDTEGSYIENQGCEVCGGDERVECLDCEGDGKVRCDECYSRSQRRSTGEIECIECDGEGEVDCGECRGSGKDSEGEECSDCNGTGKEKCGECDGGGTRDCPECDGNANVSCTNCGGDGYVDCPECQ
jgi:hypothetical protein